MTDAERQRDEVFLRLRVVHELLWLLTEALELCPPSHALARAQLALEIDLLDSLASGPVAALLEDDLDARGRAAHAALRRVGDALGGRRGAAG